MKTRLLPLRSHHPVVRGLASLFATVLLTACGGGDAGSGSPSSFADPGADGAIPDVRSDAPSGDVGGRGDGPRARDGGADDGTSMTPAPANVVRATSGGGVTSSSEYKLQISIGAPGAGGIAENSNYRIRVTPLSP